MLKKVVFGSALMICGMMGIITEYLREAIFFASPNNISYEGGYNPFNSGCLIVFAIGLALCFFSIFNKIMLNKFIFS